MRVVFLSLMHPGLVRYTSDVKTTSCGKEYLLVKCVFSIGNPTLFHAMSEMALFSNFQRESQDPAKP